MEPIAFASSASCHSSPSDTTTNPSLCKLTAEKYIRMKRSEKSFNLVELATDQSKRSRSDDHSVSFSCFSSLDVHEGTPNGVSDVEKYLNKMCLRVSHLPTEDKPRKEGKLNSSLSIQLPIQVNSELDVESQPRDCINTVSNVEPPDVSDRFIFDSPIFIF